MNFEFIFEIFVNFEFNFEIFVNFEFINLRAKRGGSLFEVGSEREENGGVTSVRK